MPLNPLSDDPPEKAAAEPISLKASVSSIIKANPVAHVGPLVLAALLFMRGGLTQTSVIVAAGLLFVPLTTTLWSVYRLKDQWIRFDTDRVFFATKGIEHNYNLGDLVSIRCPTAAQRRFLDFVQLRFKSGPMVHFSNYSASFEEAKDQFVKLLTRSKITDECITLGDCDFRAYVPTASGSEDARRRSQPAIASATSTEPACIAPRVDRLFATLIDLGICYGAILLWNWAANMQWVPHFRDLFGQNRLPILLEPLVLLVIAYLLVNGYLLAARGQTMGKWLLGIQIVDFHTNELISMRRIIMQRFIPVPLALAAAMIVLPRFIGLLWLLLLIDVAPIFREEQRCIHDMLAVSKVVKCR